MTIHNSAYFVHENGAKASQPVLLKISVFIHRIVILVVLCIFKSTPTCFEVIISTNTSPKTDKRCRITIRAIPVKDGCQEPGTRLKSVMNYDSSYSKMLPN